MWLQPWNRLTLTMENGDTVFGYCMTISPDEITINKNQKIIKSRARLCAAFKWISQKNGINCERWAAGCNTGYARDPICCSPLWRRSGS